MLTLLSKGAMKYTAQESVCICSDEKSANVDLFVDMFVCVRRNAIKESDQMTRASEKRRKKQQQPETTKTTSHYIH